MHDIRFEISDHIATITLHRPDQLNALTERMVDELIEALDRCDADDDVRVVVITGAGRGFCAGADLSQGNDSIAEWLDTTNDGDQGSSDRVRRDGGGRVALRLYDSLKPIIVAINGAAVGGGITFTLPADIRIASADAKIGFVFNQRGLVPESCSSWFLPKLVGMTTALEWVMTGRLFSAREAQEKGLLHAVHPAETLLDEARRLAQHISRNTAPVSAALARRMLWRGWEMSSPMRAHEVETHGVNVRGTSNDIREGVAAFREKRPVEFVDRVSTDLPDIFSNLPAAEYVVPDIRS